MRKSFSNLKKDLKHRLGGKKRAPDSAGANAAGERVSSSASLLQPDSYAVVSGHNEEGTGISTDISQARSSGPSPMPADEGRRDDSQRKEADVDEKEGGQRNLHLDPDIGTAAESGPGQADYSLPVTSIPHKREPDGMRTVFLSCCI